MLILRTTSRTRSLAAVSLHASVIGRPKRRSEIKKKKERGRARSVARNPQGITPLQTVLIVLIVLILIPIPTLVRAVERMGPDSMLRNVKPKVLMLDESVQ
eukprot:6950676-Prorocentrum_lima.AAC.1